MTTDRPAQRLLENLRTIPGVDGEIESLAAILEAAAACDASDPLDAERAFRELTDRANEIVATEAKSPLQVDMATTLRGREIHRAIGDEIARAAELLLRLTPFPNSPPTVEEYRKAFDSRYPMGREVPLLELLDPAVGLGTLSSEHPLVPPSPDVVRRNKALLGLAFRTMRERRRAVELDERPAWRRWKHGSRIARRPHPRSI